MRLASLTASLLVPAVALACSVGGTGLSDGEANIRYLDHSGWAVETRNRFLVFDYRMPHASPGNDAPDRAPLDPEELKDHSVVVFVSHAHGDHWDRRLLQWKETIPDITYVFGWDAGEGPGHVYCGFERQDLDLGNLRVRTIVHDFDGIPEAAFVVDVDGLTLFHSGDHGNGPAPFRDAFVDNLEYVARIAPQLDLAFLPLWGEESFVVRTLKPDHTFPMHGMAKEETYAEFARRAAEEELPTHVVAAEAPGDTFLLSGGTVTRVPRPEE